MPADSKSRTPGMSLASCNHPAYSGLLNKWMQNWNGWGPPESALKRNRLLTTILGDAVPGSVNTCMQHTRIYTNTKSSAVPLVSELFINHVIQIRKI